MVATVLEQFTAAVAAVCPITGASMGSVSDRSTWVFTPIAGATQAQIQAAQNVIATFDATAAQAAIAADAARDAAMASDVDRQDILAKIATATPTQIKNYINNNVTDLASAKVFLMKLTLLVARTLTE